MSKYIFTASLMCRSYERWSRLSQYEGPRVSMAGKMCSIRIIRAREMWFDGGSKLRRFNDLSVADGAET